MLRQHWWKLLGVLLTGYSLVAGMLVPLGPGVMEASPTTLRSGDTVVVTVSGYNTRFSYDPQIRARIKLSDSSGLCNIQTEVLDDTHLQLTVVVPSGLFPATVSPYPVLQLQGTHHGRINYKDAFRVVPDTTTQSLADLCNAADAFGSRKSGFYFPFLNILEESIRNLYFHVPMWFGMMALLLVSAVYAVRYLASQRLGISERAYHYDRAGAAFAATGLLLGILGIITGALWAKYTWGKAWSWDVKQNTSAVALLIYMAYFVLRGSFSDLDKRARFAAIYNIFAFATLIPLLYIIPRMADSLHPGMGGNPAFNSYDLDSNMRLVFYPAVLGWILMGTWMATLRTRLTAIADSLAQQ